MLVMRTLCRWCFDRSFRISRKVLGAGAVRTGEQNDNNDEGAVLEMLVLVVVAVGAAEEVLTGVRMTSGLLIGAGSWRCARGGVLLGTDLVDTVVVVVRSKSVV